MNYIVDTKKTIQVMYERIDAYDKAIDKVHKLDTLMHVLTGFNKLVQEFIYVSYILNANNCALESTAISQRIKDTLDKATNKANEIYNE